MFEDIRNIDGADNMGGLQMLAYAIPLNDLAAMPSYPAAPGSLAERVTIADTLTPKAGKKIFEIEVDAEQAKFADKLIEGNGNGYESTFEFFIKGNSPQSLGFAKVAPTTNWVMVVIDNDGQRRLLGIKAPVKLKSAEGTTGTVKENAKGTAWVAVCYQNGPAPVYTGTIDNDSGSGTGI